MVSRLGSLQRQLADAEGRLSRLYSEREGLVAFSGQVASDRGVFRQQLEGKRATASLAAEVVRAKSATGLATFLADRLGSGFESGIEESFSGVERDVDRALAQVELEIAQQRSVINSLEEAISRERERLRRESETSRA